MSSSYLLHDGSDKFSSFLLFFMTLENSNYLRPVESSLYLSINDPSIKVGHWNWKKPKNMCRRNAISSHFVFTCLLCASLGFLRQFSFSVLM